MENEKSLHKLSGVQERKLLLMLSKCEPISYGSSRVVYVDPRNSRRVVKVAVGAKSFRQNKTELRIWKDWGEEGRLARIYEYGVFCIVMERMVECYNDDYCDDDEERYDRFQDVANWLAGIVGYTSDNYQIGENYDGEFKIYDYGFLPDISSDHQCGWANEISDYTSYVLLAREILAKKLPATRIQHYYSRWAY